MYMKAKNVTGMVTGIGMELPTASSLHTTETLFHLAETLFR